jgi:hypothetical protein
MRTSDCDHQTTRALLRGSERARQAGDTVPDVTAFEPHGCDSKIGCRSDPLTNQPRPGSACEDEAVVQEQAEQLPGLETY